MTGLPCGSVNARADIEAHWRWPLRLRETKPGSGTFTGPCPLCGKRDALSVSVGYTGAVVWNVPGCKSRHSRAAAYPALKAKVECAPEPKEEHNPEADALRDAMTALALNMTLTPAALRLALLEATGTGTDEALDALGITDRSNRRRAIRDARKARALPPARMVKTDHNRRSKPSGPAQASTGPDPARNQDQAPAVMVKTDPPVWSILTTSAGQENGQKKPLTSAFPGLTDRASVVSGPAGRIRNTNTALDLALELLRTELGAQVISETPEPSPEVRRPR